MPAARRSHFSDLFCMTMMVCCISLIAE